MLVFSGWPRQIDGFVLEHSIGEDRMLTAVGRSKISKSIPLCTGGLQVHSLHL